MTGTDFVQCAKRMATVLLGRTEPSVLAVEEAATRITDPIGGALRAVYDEAVEEAVPGDLTELLMSLGQPVRHDATH